MSIHGIGYNLLVTVFKLQIKAYMDIKDVPIKEKIALQIINKFTTGLGLQNQRHGCINVHYFKGAVARD